MRIPAATLLFACLSLLAAHVDATESEKGPLDFSRIGWHRAELKLSKFFLSARSRVELSLPAADSSELGLIDVPKGGPLQPSERVLLMDLDTRFLGRESIIRLTLDPATGEAYQYEVHDQGKRFRHRFFRFGKDGVFVRTYRPSKENFDKEKRRPWQQWSNIENFYRARPPGAIGKPVTDPLAVIYLAAAAGLKPGDEPLELLALTGDSVTRMMLRPVEYDERRVSFRVEGGDRKCRGRLRALRLELTAAPLVEGGKFELDFLGLNEDIQVYIEPATRLPLEISGRAAWVGKARIRLQEAGLNGPAKCPTAA